MWSTFENAHLIKYQDVKKSRTDPIWGELTQRFAPGQLVSSIYKETNVEKSWLFKNFDITHYHKSLWEHYKIFEAIEAYTKLIYIYLTIIQISVIVYHWISQYQNLCCTMLFIFNTVILYSVLWVKIWMVLQISPRKYSFVIKDEI